MKLTYLLLLISLSAFAQTWQAAPNIVTNTDGTRFDDVFFLNDNLGWAANGQHGAIFKTTDGGLNWTEQLNHSELPGNNKYFRNVEFLNENIGFVGTLNGAFYKTVDGGDNWTEVSISPNPNAICGINAVGSSTIYGCGAYFQPAHLIKSTDSGETWTYTDMSAYANALVEVKFLDELNGFAAGRNNTGAIVLKTTDGGVTWSNIYQATISGEYVWKLQILYGNPNVMFGAIYTSQANPGKLIKSLDGGVTWTSHDAPESGVEAVGFISETKGWMGGHTTGFHETNDGGLTWTDLNIGGNLNRIFVINSTLAYAAGASVYKYTTQTLRTNNSEIYRKDLDITLSKNPVDKQLEFTINYNVGDNILIELYSSTGAFIKQLTRDSVKNKSSKTYSFSVNDLASGYYILDFHSNTGRTAKKFIKL
ncbi:YCF48-related protein [Algibacter pectinivorans]|uniref:Por secretion system C-terminal sorting domain-containing protein n=1 Tax=Algibacter pectinivorans TaxID=870482 RepID=A0A1I1MDU9_9FLAO|nr:YCF48-related protein [Algibacter pectinivorans]SFC81238.1 Por secretion system C-terminal sorting domain-containing protein [Algibacter pectinivorans]